MKKTFTFLMNKSFNQLFRLLFLLTLLASFSQISTASPLCPSSPTTFGYEYVSSITINGQTRQGNTGYSGPGYMDYSGSSLTTMVAGNTYPVSVTVVTNTTWHEYVKIWFDFNGNQNLLDPGELVFDQNHTWSGVHTFSGNITVPTTAYNGEVYLRVIMVYAAVPQLCGSYSYGNTLDFKVNITGGVTPRTLSVSKAGSYQGNVTSTPSGINTAGGYNTANFADGSNVTLTATNVAGGKFTGWTGSVTSTSPTIVVPMNSNKNIVANFAADIPADLTSITAADNLLCLGETTQLTANGTVGTVYWYSGSCGGTLIGTGNSIQVSPTSNTTYYARNYNNGHYSANCALVSISVSTLDSDGDGIADDCDLDDDNDGILDTNECISSNFFWSNSPFVSGNTATGTINGVQYTYTSSSNITTTPSVYNHGIFPAQYNVPNVNPTIQNIYVTSNTLTFASPMTNPVLVFASIGNSGAAVPITFSSPVDVLWSTAVTVNSPTKITGTEGYAIVRMNGTFSSISFNYDAAENWVNFAFGADFYTYCDTDGDGISDYLDLDSDNDGCYDAIEGSLGLSELQAPNGRLTGPVAANGIPLLAGNNGQGVGTSINASANCFCELGIDNTIPVVKTKDNTVYLDASGHASITPQAVDNGSYDNCGSVSLSLDDMTFDCSDMNAKNVATIVSDNTWSQSTVALTTPGQYVSVVNQLPNVSTYTLSASNNWPYGTVNFFSPAIPGALPIYANGGTKFYRNDFQLTGRPQSLRIRARVDNMMEIFVNGVSIGMEDDVDGANFSNTKYHDVYIDDNGVQNGYLGGMQFDVVTSQSILDLLHEGSNEIVFAIANTNGTDQGGFMVRMDAVADGVPVVLTAVDPNGNSSNATAFVVVKDSLAPVITCPTNIQVNNTPSVCGANVSFAASSTDNCSVAITYSHQPGSLFPIGLTTVTVTATDPSGNVAICTFDVEVIDVELPNISCPFDIVVNAAPGTCGTLVNYETPTGTDNCGTTAPPTSLAGHTYKGIYNGHSYFLSNGAYPPETAHANALASGGHLATISSSQENQFISGLYPDRMWIGYTDRDVEGTWRWITNEPVVYTNWAGGEPNNAGNEDWAVINWSGPTWNDWYYTQPAYYVIEFDGGTLPANLVAGLPSGSVFPVGNNVVTYEVVDPSGNRVECSFNVTVKDNQPPVAVTQHIVLPLDANGQATLTAGQVNNGSYDNCGIASLSINKTTFDCSNVGANTVTLTVTDVNGNVSTRTAVVTVEDHISPVVITQNLTLQLDANGQASVTAVQINNGSTDACGIASLALDKTNFDCSNVGLNTVILTVTDVNGNVSTDDAVVTVQDVTPPVVIVKDITVQLDANGQVAFSVNDIDDGSYDVCGILQTNMAQTPLTCAHVGENEITLVVTDINGNTASATAIVTVEDHVAPVALAQNITIQLDELGAASITPAMIDNGSNDACGIASLAVSQTDFDCSHVGQNTVTLTVTDVNGNVSTVDVVVTVEDNVAPVALAQDITIQLDELGAASITPEMIDNGSNDACGIASLVVSQTDFDCSHVGQNTVTLTVTDVNGNVSTVDIVVTVEDNVAPVALAQNITIQLDELGAASITPEMIDNGSNDACGIASLAVSQSDFDCSHVGPNTVTLTVTDVNGNVSTVDVVVTVEDNVAPVVITRNVVVNLNADGLGSITPQDIDNGSADACGIASLVLDITEFDCSNVGENTVVLTVTDINGNVASATAIVSVYDIVPPIALSQDITIQLDAAGQASITPEMIDNGSNDACGIASLSLSQLDFDCSHVGPNTVTLTVTDVNGNVSTVDAVVTVEDNIAPSLTVPADIVQLNDPLVCGAVIEVGEAITADNCAVASVVNDSPGYFVVGATTVTWTVTDVNGNQTTATQQVVITNDLPVLDELTVDTNIERDETVTASATFTDNNVLYATFEWGDGSTSNGVINGQSITGDHVYTETGIYTVNLIIEDACGEITSMTYAYVVIWSPCEGKLTAGGWLNYALGNWVDKPQLSGKATFEIEAQYKKHGGLEGKFNFDIKNKGSELKLKSTSLDWLMINGNYAVVSGSAKVGNTYGYTFWVSVVDGGNGNHSTGPNTIRVIIWDPSGNVIFDNENGVALDQQPSTEVSKGSIQIHKKDDDCDDKHADHHGDDDDDDHDGDDDDDHSGDDHFKSCTIYPNPVDDDLNLKFEGFKGDHIYFTINDSKGSKYASKVKMNIYGGSGKTKVSQYKLRKGTYVITVQDKDGKNSKSMQFIKK